MKSLIIFILTYLAASVSGEIDGKRDNNSNAVNSSNCTVEQQCDTEEDILNKMYEYIYPRDYEWVLIAIFCVVFVVGLVGNALVCLAVYRNHSMRTVTNYFIVNLAVADLLIIIVCLPPSVVWDVTETWFWGLWPCKIVVYSQTVSVAVSVLTLAFISFDRWQAICFPLRFKSTTSRAKKAIIMIWIVALIIDIPELVVLHTKQSSKITQKTVLFTQCGPSWNKENQISFTFVKFIVLYTAPLTFMSFAYCQIVRVLWRSNIPGHNISTRIINANEFGMESTVGNPEGQLKSRRKAAKMLIAVVLMFAICCLPVHVLSILRSTILIKSSTLTDIVSCLVHLLVYANSMINPLIYNFMSGKFRKEFKRTFCCPRTRGSRNRAVYRTAGMSKNQLMRRSLQTTCNNYHTRSMHTTINNNNDLQHSTEIVPLSAVCPSAQQPGYHHAKQR